MKALVYTPLVAFVVMALAVVAGLIVGRA